MLMYLSCLQCMFVCHEAKQQFSKPLPVIRSEVDSMNNNQACDIIGLVTYVGRVERIRSKEKTGIVFY